MQNITEKIIKTSLVPIVILNILGGIIGAIWLFILGEWRLVISAFFVSLVFPFLYSLLMLIQVPCMAILGYFINKKKKTFAKIAGFVGMLIGHGVNLGWVILVFSYAIEFSEGRILIPYLLYGWEIAIGPFQYMASKEPPDSIGSYMAVYLTQISYLILVISFLLGITPFALPIIIFITIITEIYLLKSGFQSEEFGENNLYSSQNINICRNCGNRLDEDSKYCVRCGERADLPPANNLCKNCGNQLDDDSKYCTQCGTKVVK